LLIYYAVKLTTKITFQNKNNTVDFA